MYSEENNHHMGKIPRRICWPWPWRSGEPTCDVAAKTNKLLGGLDGGSQCPKVRGLASLCPGQGQGKVTKAWGRLGTG